MCPRTHSHRGPSSSRPLAAVYPPPAPSLRYTHHQSPQVNRSVFCNSQSTNALPQILRYTCGSASAANVPQTCFSGQPVRNTPPQVNRSVFCNSQSTNVLPKTSRYTCEGPPSGNVPQTCFSGRSVRNTPPQVNRSVFCNSQSTNALPQILRYTCEK